MKSASLAVDFPRIFSVAFIGHWLANHSNINNFLHWLVSMQQTTIHRPDNYRSDIDGLRAIAILCVIIYHAFPTVLPAGFVGVDFFFVISGYLITNIILQDHSRGSFRYLHFYRNRIKRIFPALICVLFVFLFAGYFLLLPGEFSDLGKHVAGGAGFIDNILYSKEKGYFNTASDLKPLLHLWSLGVEEQFYFVIPLLITIGWYLRINMSLLMFSIVIISFTINIIIVENDMTTAFFLPHTRMWEIAIGGFLAALLNHDKYQHSNITASRIPIVFALSSEQKEKWRTVASILGLALFFASLYFIDKHRKFPGIWAALPVCSATFLIAAGKDTWLNRYLLSHPLLVGIGLISFPLYLWHWPLLSFSRVISSGEPSVVTRVLILIASFMLSIITYFFIEKSFRYRPTKTKIAFLCSAAMLMCLFGFLSFKKIILPYSTHFGLDKILAATSDWLPEVPITELDGITLKGIKGDVNTLIYGDSLAIQYLPRAIKLVREQTDSKRGVLILDGGGYPAFPGSTRSDGKYNGVYDKFERLLQNKSIDTIIITGIWYKCFGGYTDESFIINVDGISVLTPEGRKKAVESWNRVMRMIQDKMVYLVYTTPIDPDLYSHNMIQRSVIPPNYSIQTKNIDCGKFIKKYEFAYDFVQSLAKTYGAVFIDPSSYLCTDGFCNSVDVDGKPIYMNSAHMASSFVRDRVTYLDDAMLGRQLNALSYQSKY